MDRSASDRRIWAAGMAAGAVMLLCFAQRNMTMTPLDRLPYEPPAAAQESAGELVNVNTAGLEELTSLPGIGETRARAIIEDREANGPYRFPENLIRVKGIGESVLSGMLDRITTGGEGDAENSGG